MPATHRVSNNLAVALILAGAVGLAGCDVIVNTMEGNGRATDTWTRTYTVAKPDARVEIVNVNGRVDVTAVDGTQVTIVAERTARGATDEAAAQSLKQVEMREEVSPDRIRVETKAPKMHFGRGGVDVKYHVKVPKTMIVTAETVNGGVEVVGVQGGVRAESTNGGVTGRGLGQNVKASTTNGSVDIEVTTLGADGVSLETTNGGIKLRIPDGAKANISARCTNGGISVSDLPGFEPSGDNTRRRVDGKLNGGGPSIRLETTNGGIKVLKY
jgi:hypothetical protein